jgi:hypothetical protein
MLQSRASGAEAFLTPSGRLIVCDANGEMHRARARPRSGGKMARRPEATNLSQRSLPSMTLQISAKTRKLPPFFEPSGDCAVGALHLKTDFESGARRPEDCMDQGIVDGCSGTWLKHCIGIFGPLGRRS